MDILDGFPGYGSTPNNLGPGGKAPQATLYLITLPSTGIIWSTTPSTLILSSSFHPGARLSKPNLPQTSQGQWSTTVTSWKPGFCWALVILFLHSLHCSDEAGPPKTLNVTVVKDEWHNELPFSFLNEQIVPFELDAFTFIFTFAYFELHMLSQKLNQRKPQEEGVEHQNQFDSCFLQLLLLWPINHGQPLPAQRVVVTWPKSNSYQSFGGSDYWCVLLLWTTWWRVVRELENVSRGKTF